MKFDSVCDAMTLDQLIDDCLIKVFKLLDEASLVNLSEVSRQFNGILHGNIFPNHKMLTFNLCRCSDISDCRWLWKGTTSMNLALMRKYLRCFGPYLTDVKFLFCNNFNTKPVNLDIRRLFNKFAQLVGPNLKKLHIRKLPLTESQLDELKPVLRQLDEFKLLFGRDDHFCYGRDFISLFPNLKKFSFSGSMNSVHFTHKWQSLESLTYFEYDVENETLPLLVRNNPQLKHLAVFTYYCEELMQSLARHLKQLEKLTLYDDVDEDSATISERTLIHLRELQHLHILKLMFVRDSDLLNGILRFLPKLIGLQTIRLHCNLKSLHATKAHLDHRLFIELAKQMTNLKVFHIAYVQLDEENIVDFIRYAEPLQEIFIYECDTPMNAMNENSIHRIVNARKSSIHAEPLVYIFDVDDGEREDDFQYIEVSK